jgi:glutathione S-transferase
VPTLVLNDGEALFESAAILDYLEELAGADHALLPRSGIERRRALKLMATATGAAEKGIAQVYERVFRPAEKIHQPWLDRCASQLDAALKQLDDECAKRPANAWLLGNTMTLVDITVTCAVTFLTDALELNIAGFPALQALTLRCEALPVFKETRLAFFVPKS